MIFPYYFVESESLRPPRLNDLRILAGNPHRKDGERNCQSVSGMRIGLFAVIGCCEATGRLLPNPLRYSQRKSVESIHLYSWGMTVHINRPQGVQGRRDLVVLYAKVVKALKLLRMACMLTP
jgi:hypothetical protein